MGYMTKQEMLERLNDGEHPVLISLDKWKRAIPGKRISQFWFDEHCISDTCACCDKYNCYYSDEDCPMIIDDLTCDNKCHPWNLAMEAAYSMNMVDFMGYRKEIIDHLKQTKKELGL